MATIFLGLNVLTILVILGDLHAIDYIEHVISAAMNTLHVVSRANKIEKHL